MIGGLRAVVELLAPSVAPPLDGVERLRKCPSGFREAVLTVSVGVHEESLTELAKSRGQDARRDSLELALERAV